MESITLYKCCSIVLIWIVIFSLVEFSTTRAISNVNVNDYEIVNNKCPEDIRENRAIHDFFVDLYPRENATIRKKLPESRHMYFFPEQNAYENISVVRKFHHKKSTYKTSTKLCDQTFQSKDFLELFKNKQITLTGDSLLRQLFNAMTGRLHTHEARLRTRWYWPKQQFLVYENYYPAYNLTLTYCGDSNAQLLLNIRNRSHPRNCVHEMLQTADYIILGYAAWWKPFFLVEPKIAPTYKENFHLSTAKFQREMLQAREMLAEETKERHVPIMWKLSSHVGDMEERSARIKSPAYVLHDIRWSTNYTQCEAEWVPIYNNIMLDIATAREDIVLRHDLFSHQFLQSILSMNVTERIHWDFLHFVIEGFPVGSCLLLFDKLLEARELATSMKI